MINLLVLFHGCCHIGSLMFTMEEQIVYSL